MKRAERRDHRRYRAKEELSKSSQSDHQNEQTEKGQSNSKSQDEKFKELSITWSNVIPGIFAVRRAKRQDGRAKKELLKPSQSNHQKDQTEKGPSNSQSQDDQTKKSFDECLNSKDDTDQLQKTSEALPLVQPEVTEEIRKQLIENLSSKYDTEQVGNMLESLKGSRPVHPEVSEDVLKIIRGLSTLRRNELLWNLVQYTDLTNSEQLERIMYLKNLFAKSFPSAEKQSQPSPPAKEASLTYIVAQFDKLSFNDQSAFLQQLKQQGSLSQHSIFLPPENRTSLNMEPTDHNVPDDFLDMIAETLAPTCLAPPSSEWNKSSPDQKEYVRRVWGQIFDSLRLGPCIRTGSERSGGHAKIDHEPLRAYLDYLKARPGSRACSPPPLPPRPPNLYRDASYRSERWTKECVPHGGQKAHDQDGQHLRKDSTSTQSSSQSSDRWVED